MSTFMESTTFTELQQIRKKLCTEASARESSGRPAGIFVPWAGGRLSEEGGIYVVGMATRGDFEADDDSRTFEACQRIPESLATSRRDAKTQFWQFLDGLTWALLGGSYDQTSDHWGWSNLIKIGWSMGGPQHWEKSLIAAQREVCARSLQEECGKLRNSLIVVTSGDCFGILKQDGPGILAPSVPHWDKRHEEIGLWSAQDPISGNIVVWSYHPRAAVREGSWGSVLGRTIHLARTLPWSSLGSGSRR